MSFATPSLARQFEAAREAYAQDRPADAARLLDAVIRADPRSSQAQHLMGLSLLALGDLEGAEAALRAAIAADKRRPSAHAALGDVLTRTGRADEAERAYRAALALDRLHLHAAAGLTRLLLSQERKQEALQTITPLAVGVQAPHYALSLQADALRRLGRLEEALAVGRRAVAAGSAMGEVDLAATLRELGRYDEAEAAARRALATLGPRPVAFLGLGRALQDLGRFEEAEVQYREGLAVAALDPALHQALAELTLKRTDDAEKAAAPLDSVLRPTPPLIALRAKLHSRAGRPDRADALLSDAVREMPGDALLHAAAASAAARAGDPDRALALAERARALAPGSPKIEALVAEAANAAGRPERAAEIAARLLRAHPEDQSVIALQAVAWRLMGDPRYRELYDYDAFVQAYTLPPPDGWPSLEAFLADLAAALTSMHAARGDPLDQSLRKGTQTEQNLALSSDPVLAAFFAAVKAPVAEYLRRIGRGSGPMRSRNTGRAKVKAAWSVKLEPEGFHADHLHPDGWISSAFYVALPTAMAGEDRQGWIKFGEPGAPTRPKLEAEHFVRPEPGRLVLFPSYMWHGTVPFSGHETRLTMAFDLIPER